MSFVNAHLEGLVTKNFKYWKNKYTWIKLYFQKYINKSSDVIVKVQKSEDKIKKI